MKNVKIFKSENGLELIVKHRRSAVIFEIREDSLEGREEDYQFRFRFNEEDFKELFEYLKDISNKSWQNIVPKEANSFGSDYFEYYDRKLDNNGYLDIESNTLFVKRPSSDSNKLYQFNKRKMESFLYDYERLIWLLMIILNANIINNWI